MQTVHRHDKQPTLINTAVNRYDRIDAPAWMVRPFERTDEGYLKGRAVVTNVGVFLYQDGAGGIRRELRPPEEVFAPDSVASLKVKPVTNEHPKEAVTADNVRKYQAGTTGSNPTTDGMDIGDPGDGLPPRTDRYHLSVDMTITDAEAVTDVLAGKRALSSGYTAELEDSSGVWMGIPYDVIQRNIRYNHVAIVDRARAGDAARIILREDSADAVCVGRVAPEYHTFKEDEAMSLKKITIDGVEYQAEADVIKALNEAKARADELAKQLAVKDAEIDTLKDKAEKLDADLKAAQATDKIEAAVKSRLRVLDAAARAGVEVKDDMDEAAVKRAVVLSVFPNADKEKLEKADAVYLDGRFDGALESLAETEGASQRNRQSVSDLPKGGERTDDGDSEAARDRMITDQQNAYKRESA